MNTPVILLDGLSAEDALRVKEYFSRQGVEACCTQNRGVKKICYRVKWRNTPPLDFLSDFSPSSRPDSAASFDRSVLESALLDKDTKLRPLEADRQLEKRIADEKITQVTRELEDWKNRGEALRRDVQVLTEARDQLQRSLSEAQQGRAAKLPPAAPSTLPLQPAGGGEAEVLKLREEVHDLIRAKERLESALLGAKSELDAAEKQNRLFAIEREKLEHAAMSAHDGKRHAMQASEELKVQLAGMADEIKALEDARDSFEKALAQTQTQWELSRKMAAILETDRGGLERSLLQARSLYAALLKDAQSWQKKAGSLTEASGAAQQSAPEGNAADFLKAMDEARDQYRRIETECRLVRDYFERKFEEIRKTFESGQP